MNSLVTAVKVELKNVWGGSDQARSLLGETIFAEVHTAAGELIAVSDDVNGSEPMLSFPFVVPRGVASSGGHVPSLSKTVTVTVKYHGCCCDRTYASGPLEVFFEEIHEPVSVSFMSLKSSGREVALLNYKISRLRSV